MEKAIDKYFQFIINTIITDIDGFNHWWMWFIIPAMFYFVFLMFKFILILLPMWFPLLIITLPFRKDIQNNHHNYHNHFDKNTKQE